MAGVKGEIKIFSLNPGEYGKEAGFRVSESKNDKNIHNVGLEPYFSNLKGVR